MQKCLFVDRSSQGGGSFAIYEDGKCVAFEPYANITQHISNAADFDLLCAAIGPGSYSGIRSALAFLQGLALPYGTPVVGIATAAVMAYKTSAAIIEGDARRGKIWHFENGNFSLLPKPDGWREQLSAIDARDVAAIYFANPAVAVPNPVPIYLHPAVL